MTLFEVRMNAPTTIQQRLSVVEEQTAAMDPMNGQIQQARKSDMVVTPLGQTHNRMGEDSTVSVQV